MQPLVQFSQEIQQTKWTTNFDSEMLERCGWSRRYRSHRTAKILPLWAKDGLYPQALCASGKYAWREGVVIAIWKVGEESGAQYLRMLWLEEDWKPFQGGGVGNYWFGDRGLFERWLFHQYTRRRHNHISQQPLPPIFKPHSILKLR
jgi:hypothetical protein